MKKSQYIIYFFFFFLSVSAVQLHAQKDPKPLACNCNVLIPAATIYSVTCNGGSNGGATANGNSFGVDCVPESYEFYEWFNSGGTSIGTGATISGLSAGVYTVVWENDNCFGVTRTVTITQPAAITGNISHTNEICNQNDGTVTVSSVAGGTGSYTYSWTFNGNPIAGTSPALVGCTAGTYACTVKDANNCSLVLSNVVGNNTNPPSGSIGTPTHVTCFGAANGSATASATGGGGAPYTYAWSPSGGNAATANNLGPGTYTCNITGSNGCTDPSPPTVTITQPSAALFIASYGMNPVSCNGGNTGSASVSGISGGTSPYTYSWSPSGGNAAVANGLSAGFYTCTVRDANNCSVVGNPIQVTEPAQISIGSITATPVLCFGGSTGSATVSSITGGWGAYTYAWTPSGGNAATANNLAAGFYSCTVWDANNCSVLSTAVQVTQPSSGLGASASSTAANCGTATGSASANASGGTIPYTYQWSPSGGVGATANNLFAGSYTVFVTDNNGCTTSSSTIVNSTGSLNAVLTASTSVTCFGGNNGSATVNATGGTGTLTYAWSSIGGNSPTANNLTAGNYNVTVTDNAGCSDIVTFSISQPAVITASMTTTPAACATSNGTAKATPSGGTGAYTYAWNTVPVQITQTATGLPAGTYSVTVRDANNCSRVFSATVGTVPSPLVSFLTTSVTCNGGNNGSATATPTGGGGPPYTYVWSTTPVKSTATVTGLAAGNYTVHVSTSTCSNTVTVAVTQPAPISAVMTTTPTPCLQSIGSANATASGGTAPFTYLWSPTPQTTQTATGLASGFYTVTITDKNGCTKNSTAVVNSIGGPTVTATPSPVTCFGGNDGAAVLNVSGTAPFSYSWSPSGGTSSAATNLSAQVYLASVTDGSGCVTTIQVSIAQPAQLLPNVVSNTVAVCKGSASTIGANASGGSSPYVYTWSGSAGLSCVTCQNPSANPTSNTNYTVTVTDKDGCTAAGTVSVTVNNLPAINAGPPGLTLCTGTSTTLNATGGSTYVWSPSSGLSNTTIANPVANPSTAITYSVIGKDANGCAGSDTVQIKFMYIPPVITTSSTYSTICIGSSLDTLKATGGTSYLWNDGLTTQTTSAIVVSPDVSTTYTVTVTNSIGCKGQATISVNVTSGFPVPVVSPTGPLSFCLGDSIPGLTATPNPVTNGIAWVLNAVTTIGNTFLPPQNLPVGTHPVYCVQGTGTSCLSNPTVVNIIINPLPNANAGTGGTVCPGFSMQLKGAGGTGYMWSPSTGLSDPNISNPTAEPELTTTYFVTVTDASNCRNRDSVTVHVVLNDTCLVVIYNLISPNGDNDNDAWWIDGIRFFPDNHVRIFNRWGAKVWEGKGYDNDKVIWRGDNQNGAKLPVSTYYYIIDLGSRTFNGFVELVE